MPTNGCQFYYECTNCGAMLAPERPGDCCVFCSFGSGEVPADPGRALLLRLAWPLRQGLDRQLRNDQEERIEHVKTAQYERDSANDLENALMLCEWLHRFQGP